MGTPWGVDDQRSGEPTPPASPREARLTHRTIVQIARMRLADITKGDTINGQPDSEDGWFEVRSVRALPSGERVVAGKSSTQSIKGASWDLIGGQIAKNIEVADPTTFAAVAG